MNDKALTEFTSHITGKNAKVRLWPDRIEWELVGRMSTGAKAVLGAATMGMSLLATGVRGKRETNMILVRSITGVTTRKSGLMQNEVVVSTPAGTVDFRCSTSEAAEFKRQLLALIG
ncbi:hypothetical protein G7085_08965 [Tessaracoccus sp. HDW20]|uniref:hypothetical protein n=1 Tax=Tessaracoccus coleopterorum TaxID=2714950 RepID=UPI0018D41246|nr:hypothetical protein [Tessaracoccus coleopterorum]NHB84696.1 hypothetical protein [Tessaracoccus coleopterorum]